MGESMEKEEDESEMKGSFRCTPEQLGALSKILADHYSKLAPKLGIEKEDVKKFEEAHEKNDERWVVEKLFLMVIFLL